MLVLTDYYLPGFKAGGPVRTIANVIDRLGHEFHFRVVTRDRDIGDETAYHDVRPDEWTPIGKAEVRYVSPSMLTWKGLRRLLRDESYDVLYLNSLFSFPFTFRTLVWRRLGVRRDRPLILAPRGELASGALSLGTAKKRAYLWIARHFALLRGVVWQASSEHEAADITAQLARLGVTDAIVRIAPDLPPRPSTEPSRSPKSPGSLRLVFLARVSRMKNLDGALRALCGVTGDMSFDIYGPIEDAEYWNECKSIIGRMPPNVRVRAHGVVSPEETTRALLAHDVLLQPSLGENFGHAIIEAMGAGCPVIISDRTPWRHLEPLRAGVDVPLEDPQALRAAIERFRNMDHAEFSEWTRGALALAHQVMSDSETTDQMRNLLLTRER